MTNLDVKREIEQLKSEIDFSVFTLNKKNKECVKKIKELQALCTHKNNDNNFARNDKGYCIYCGAMIDDCN